MSTRQPSALHRPSRSRAVWLPSSKSSTDTRQQTQSARAARQSCRRVCCHSERTSVGSSSRNLFELEPRETAEPGARSLVMSWVRMSSVRPESAPAASRAAAAAAILIESARARTAAALAPFALWTGIAIRDPAIAEVRAAAGLSPAALSPPNYTYRSTRVWCTYRGCKQ
eukprot:7386785-Prymnesium_polylepis.1